MSDKSFSEVVRTRHSSRGFLSTPVPLPKILEVLTEAQMAPSNCNTQPWIVHLVSGAKRDELSAAMLVEAKAGRRAPDFPFDREAFSGLYQQRNAQQAKTYYEALGVTRDDKEARESAYRRNFEFFGAPHAALLFMPDFYDVRVAADVGMYAQNFLLSLTAHGLAGIPQTSLSYFAPTTREILRIPENQKFLFGISFGYADPNYVANGFQLGRAPINENVVFHGTSEIDDREN